MSVEYNSQNESIELEPRGKILFINVNPDNEPHLTVARMMYGKDAELKGFQNADFRQIQSPNSQDIPQMNRREYKSKLDIPSLSEIGDFVGLVITGSPYKVYPRNRTEDNRLYVANWKMKLHKLIRKANVEDLPVLGFCFGGQEIAEAMGGKVENMRTKRGSNVWEIGFSNVTKSPDSLNDPIMKGLPDEFLAIQNHTDIISRLPEKAVLLAENKYGVQGFRLGRMWGFQFHPEKTFLDIENYLTNAGKSRKKRLENHGKIAIDILDSGRSYSGEPGLIFENFLQEAWKGTQ